VISRTAEYAIRASLWLAANTGHPKTVQQIARATALPPKYLAKILRLLARAGIVQSQPGPGGGCLLVRRPEELALLEVIEAVDPIPRVRDCPLGLAGRQSKLCPLHARLDAALSGLQNTFAGCTLAELLAESGAGGLFCIDSASSGVHEDSGNQPDPQARGRRAAAAFNPDPVSLSPEQVEQAPKGTEP
jgi:Rrf2 family protein